MDNNKLHKVADKFLQPNATPKSTADGSEIEFCDAQTGECYVMRSKDGIVERINKKFITEDGRQLLQD